MTVPYARIWYRCCVPFLESNEDESRGEGSLLTSKNMEPAADGAAAVKRKEVDVADGDSSAPLPPSKKFFRGRAHANPLSDHTFDVPATVEDAPWCVPLLFCLFLKRTCGICAGRKSYMCTQFC